MIVAYLKQPNKDVEEKYFEDASAFESFVRNRIGEKTGVLVPNDQLQVIYNKDSFTKAGFSDNLLINVNGETFMLKGNVIFTCLGAKIENFKKKDDIVCNMAFKEEYEKIKNSQDELFQEWFYL